MCRLPTAFSRFTEKYKFVLWIQFNETHQMTEICDPTRVSDLEGGGKPATTDAVTVLLICDNGRLLCYGDA